MRLPVLLFIAAACGSDRHQISIGAPPDRMTHATLAGPLCSGDRCKCRDLAAPDDAGAGVPEAGHKRFEIRMTSPQALWATVDGQVLYKSAEQVENCFYVDLASPRDFPIELRASNADGVSAKWAIHELGTQSKSWYDTFDFACGSPGVCSFEELDDAKAAQAHAKRDACGSVKVKSVTWDTGKAPDQLHPSELLVRLTLDVYKFEPARKHGEDCSKKQ